MTVCSLFHLSRDRGWELYYKDKFEEAIAEWRVAADLDPEDGYILAAIGEALAELGQMEAAFGEWQQAVHLEPDYDVPYIHLADALLAAGHASKALTTIRAAIRLCPASANLYIRLGHYLAAQADEKSDKACWGAAAEAFQQAIVIEPTNSYARRHLAKTQWARGNKRTATVTMKAAVAVNPNSLEALGQLGRYQARTGNLLGEFRTICAIVRLPETEEKQQYLFGTYSQRTLVLLVGAGLAAVLTGVWIWKRRRRDT